jgi:hypothetical protein
VRFGGVKPWNSGIVDEIEPVIEFHPDVLIRFNGGLTSIQHGEWGFWGSLFFSFQSQFPNILW